MEEKKYEIVVVFGTDAVKAYSRAWDDNERMSEVILEELGCVKRRSFNTQEEYDAYVMALCDADGWLENVVAREEYLKP